jgi:hypothetical protein
MDWRQRQDLDNYITGHYGEDQFKEEPQDGEEDYPPELDNDFDEMEDMFADPGGVSALRAATAGNPRIHPCPTCGEENMLTPEDVALGYQCDTCADKLERGVD